MEGIFDLKKKKKGNGKGGDFPGSPLAKTPSSQCKGPGFNPWSEK